ncbi:MAG: ATP synthase F1 subunit gamma [Gemmatimonadales bacterium]
MATGQQLKGRIRSVQNTRKITRTMELVAASKLKRAQDRVRAARPYAEALATVIGDLVTPELIERFPLLQQPKAPDQGGPAQAAVIMLTSNRGLAGGFNANLAKMSLARIEELKAAGYSVDIYAIGKKGIGYFKYLGRTMAGQRQDIGDKPTTDHAAEVMDPLVRAFIDGQLASVDLVFAKFNSALSTPPTVMHILPIVPPERAGGTAPDFILRPSAEEIAERLLPLYVRNQMFRGLVETAASEHGARRTAMKSATDNAGDIIQYLQRTFNKQRQAQITQEIAEIVGGAASLEG